MVESSALDRFEETCKASGGVADEQKNIIWQAIKSKYSEAGRHYHNLSHLLSMFEFTRRAAKSGYSLRNPAAVDWAIWFHDIIHDPQNSSSNEAESAALAGELLLSAGIPADTVTKIQSYIMATKEHYHLEGDFDADLVVDADLSILGAPLTKYVDYAMAIRKEYGHLSDEEFTKGRARVLKGLLDREQLFLTDLGKSTCEAAARANMGHEWRLVYAGQLLQSATLEEDEELAEEPPADSNCSSKALADGSAAADEVNS